MEEPELGEGRASPTRQPWPPKGATLCLGESDRLNQFPIHPAHFRDPGNWICPPLDQASCETRSRTLGKRDAGALITTPCCSPRPHQLEPNSHPAEDREAERNGGTGDWIYVEKMVSAGPLEMERVREGEAGWRV